MAPLELDGDTLGNKHQHYNKMLKEAIGQHQPTPNSTLDDNDVENLLKIDLASHNRDVEYIINVLRHGDMLCVSRAIAQSTWMITDQQYAHIINPEYLHTQLQPQVTTKTFIKLKKHIRHHIKDEARAEKFYLQEKILTDAVKWLPSCSVSFIEKNVEKHANHLKVRTFKRLCEKSISIFEIILKYVQSYERKRFAQAVTFFLNTDVDKYLDILENDKYSIYGIPNFNDKATALIMKKSPKRIMNKFELYALSVDLPTVSKYLKTDEVKSFLYTQANKDQDCPEFYTMHRFFKYNILKHFIKRLPKSEQFEFVKKVFIDKENAEAVEENLTVGTEAYGMKKLYKAVKTPSYLWYNFATFQRAFDDITRLISKDEDNQKKHSMLVVLMSCADHNLQHVQTLLEYYLNKHKHEEYNFTLQFVTELLKHTHVYQYDEKTWNLLNELFKILKIYDESNVHSEHANLCVDSIIIYNLLHDKKVPAVVEKQANFSSPNLKYRSKLNREQTEKIFRYYYENQLHKLSEPINSNEDLTKSVHTLHNILRLLQDWQKQLLDYPFVVDKIKEFAQIKREKSWKVDLSILYNVNKSWRKHMFEDSLTMNPGEEVCLNALKHDPQLLVHHDSEVAMLRTNDAVSLRRLIARLRVYWPHSIAKQWTDAYLRHINDNDGHKATIRGLCTALPREPLLQFIEKYKPAQAKIDWNAVDDRILSIQRFLAKNMHIARPQPSPDSILGYAKGDYLQFSLPSLHAIFYNLNITQSLEHIPKLLNAPVSVQKHGIRFAFQNLDHEDTKKIFFDCWKISKNASIRAIIFQSAFKLLCNEKDPAKAVGFWELIELFIDNLSFEEDKKIYELLADVEKIPPNVRAGFLMKSYKFMENLIPRVKETDREKYEGFSAQLAHHCREIMEDLCPDFVTGIIQEFIDKDFFDSKHKFGSVEWSYGLIPVISAFLLCTKNEEIQIQKYEQIFVPMMKRAFAAWDEKRDGSFIIRSQFQYLLTRFGVDLKEYVVNKNMIIPVKMFLNIQNELQNNLSISQNYLMLTKWKLTVAVAQLAHQTDYDTNEWDNLSIEIAPDLGKICLSYLKEDVQLHFPCIYKLFCKAFKNLANQLFSDDAKLLIYDCFLSDNEFVQGYLTVIDITNESYKCDITGFAKLWEQIESHPSVEVKMHYYYYGGDRVTKLG